MKKGFTLMEVLAVVLILAVIAGLAVPAVRSIRAEIRLRQAKAAAVKFAQAILMVKSRTGRDVYTIFTQNEHNTASFTPTETAGRNVLTTNHQCSLDEATGIPFRRTSGSGGRILPHVFFACGYLEARDFLGLPYNFVACLNEKDDCFVQMTGMSGAGKYEDRCFTLYKDPMRWSEGC